MAHALPVQFTLFPSSPEGFLVDMGTRDNGDLWVGTSNGMPFIKPFAGSTFSESIIGHSKPGTPGGLTCGSGGAGGYPGADFYFPKHYVGGISYYYAVPMKVLLSGASDFSEVPGIYDYWTGVTVKPNNDVWACSYQNYNVTGPDPDYLKGKVFRKLSTETEFTKIIGPDDNFYSAIVSDADGNIYLAVYNGDIYFIPSGSITPSAFGAGTKKWSALTVDFATGDVYAMEGDSSNYGHIFVRYGGAGSFVDLGNWSSKKWTALCMGLDGILYGAARDSSYPYTGRVYKRDLPPDPPTNHIFYVRADGSNTYPYDTPVKAAPTIYDLTTGMTTHGMILDSEDTINLKGTITETAETYQSNDLNGADLIGDSENSNLDIVNIFGNQVVNADKVRNIQFISSNPNAYPLVNCLDVEGNKIIIDASAWGEWEGFSSLFDVSTSVTKFRLVNNLFVVLNLPPNNFAGISISISNSSMDQLIIENNTFDGIVGYNPDTFDFIGVFIKLSGTGTIPIFSFRNNIVSGSPYKVIFDFESWTPVGGMTFQHTYNDYFPEIPDSPEGNPLVLDSTEKNLDPLYNGSDPEPYILQPSSPARHTGHHFTDSPTLDILNKSRSNPPNMGAFEDLGSAPVINLQPLSAIMHIYQNASFFVGADGTPTVSYEWLFDSTPLVNGGRITGVDTTHLTIASLTIEDAGFYSVRVYNGILPDTTSNDATLTILSDYIGGLIGFSIPDATIINSYWDVETSKQTTSFGGEGKTTLEMQTKFTYVNWDFTNLWRLSDATV